MRLIDADKLIRGRDENDPVRIAVMSVATDTKISMPLNNIIERMETLRKNVGKDEAYIQEVLDSPLKFSEAVQRAIIDRAIEIVKEEIE